MSEVIEAPPSAEVAQDVAPQVPAADAGNEAKATEVDFDRVLSGDEAYITETNKRLAGDVPPEEPQKDEEKAEKQETKEPEKDAKPPLDPEEVVETITFRGKSEPVKRREQKALLQKGRLLDTRLSELSHLIALEREAPDLANLARTPEGRKQVIERIRAQEKAKDAAAEDDLPEVEGYDKNDVAAVARITRATLEKQLKAMGITPKQADAAGLTPAALEKTAKEQAELNKEAELTIRVMRRADRDFEPKFALLQEIMKRARIELPEAQFTDLYNKINDPRILHPETGEPVFTHFWEHVVTPELNRQKTRTQPAAAAVPAIPRKVQAPSGRMAPGSAISPASPAREVDYTKLPQDQFEKVFREALARG
jgi:hypothetical protein